VPSITDGFSLTNRNGRNSASPKSDLRFPV
jgi:hypothetical protein